MTERLKIEDPKVKFLSKIFNYKLNENLNGGFYISEKNGLSSYLTIIDKNITINAQDMFSYLLSIDDYLFVCSRVNIYPIKGSSKKSTLSMSATGENFKVFSLNYSGQKEYLFTNTNCACLFDENLTTRTDINLPLGQTTVLLNDRFFVLNNSVLTFTEKVNADNLKSNIKIDGVINFSEKDGKIIEIITLDNKLLILGEKSIYLLDAYGKNTEFEMEKLSVDNYSILPKTCVEMNGAVYFLGEKKLYYIKNKRLYSQKIQTSNFRKDSNLYCSSYKNYYLIPFYTPASGFLCIDTLNGKEDMFADNNKFANSGGYLLDGNVIRYLRETYRNNNIGVNRIFTFLDTKRKKYVKKIFVDCLGTAKMLIQHGEGSNTFSLTNGLNELDARITTNTLNISFSEKSEGFFINEVKIIYRVLR